MAEKEYIEREKCRAALISYLNAPHIQCGDYASIISVEGCIKAFDGVPSADAVEVRHGEWEVVSGVFTPGGDPLKRCPYCKSEESEHIDGIENQCRWNWCPVCGAKMDGGKTC